MSATITVDKSNTNSSSTNTVATKTNQTINNNNKNNNNNNNNRAKLLESFWKLSEFNQNLRDKGIKEIQTYVSSINRDTFTTTTTTKNKGDDQQKQANNNNNDDDFLYTLKRLIRGLASNRKCSRLGYSCALTQVLNEFKDDLKFEKVIELANNELKLSELTQQETQEKADSDKSSNTMMTYDELRNAQIGYAFVYLCLIKSNRIDDIKSNIELIINSLNKIRQHKSTKYYIKQLYLDVIILLIKTINNKKVFKKQIEPILLNDLKSYANSKDNLHLKLAVLNTYQQEDTNEKINLSAQDDKLYEYISQSSESLPKLSSFCEELLNYAVNHENFEQFWLNLIDRRLCAPKSPDKKCLAINLWLYAISCINKSTKDNVINALMVNSTNIIACYMNNYLNKTKSLHFIIQKTLNKQLIDCLKQKEIDLNEQKTSIGSRLLIKFMTHNQQQLQLNDLISNFTAILNNHGLNDVYKHIVSQLTTVNKSIDDVDVYLNYQIWLLNQLSSFAKNENIFENSELLSNIFKFFLFNTLFQRPATNSGVNEKDVDLKTFIVGLTNANNERRLNELLKDILYKYVGFILSKNDLNLSKIIFDQYNYIKKSNLLSKYQLRTQQTHVKLEDLSKLWSKITGLMQSILEIKDNNNNDDNVRLAFFLIVSFEGLRMFDSYANSVNLIEDLDISFDKSKSKQKSKTINEDEPEWIDIIVEMLLNLYTINNRWIRNSLTNTFKKLIPTLTVDSVKLLFDLLEPNNDLIEEVDEEMKENGGGEDDEDEDEAEDEDEKMEGEENDSEKKKDKKKKMVNGNGKMSESEDEESEDEDDDDDDDDDEEINEIDEALKRAVDQALGDAAFHNSDQSDIDLDDADEDELQKYDEALSKAFKMRKKSKLIETDLIQLKSKVVDLIYEIYKSSSRLDLIVYSIKPMLNILFESQKKANLKAVSQRILSLLVNLKSIKKFNDSKYPQLDELFDLLSHAISCSVTHFSATNVLVEISIFCVRLIQHYITNEKSSEKKAKIQNKLTDVYSNLIKNFYTKNETKVNPAIHKEYLVRFPSLSLPLAIQMIEYASSANVKLHKKTITLVTLNKAINSQMFDGVEAESVNAFTNKIFTFFNQVIDQIIDEENVHIKFVDALLSLVSRVIKIDNLDSSLIDNLIKKLDELSKSTKVKQQYKSRCINLIKLCNSKSGVKRKIQEESGNNNNNTKSNKKKKT